MKITVRAYAHLRHFLPDKKEFVDLDIEKEITIKSILDMLTIPMAEILTVVINGNNISDYNTIISSDTKIDILPIVAGG